MRKQVFFGAAGVALLLIVGEIGVRVSGLVDFPIYQANNHIGYIPAPSQSGSFMRTNDWAFNDLSMGTTEAFAPSNGTDILLVGDSIVLGGNPYRQQDRLGPQLAKSTGASIWPISAGSWALQNELTYLRDHPEVTSKVDQVVFILNSADFGAPSSWRSEETHPRSHPLSALWYLVRKYVLPTELPPQDPSMLVEARDWRKDFASFAEKVSVPVFVFLYPSRDRSQDKNLEQGLELNGLGATSITLVSDDERWKDTLYRDEIHPTVEGTSILADIIASVTGTSEASD